MLAMQYSIPLPHHVGREQIVRRVEQRKDLFHNLPGLAHKSYLFNAEEHIYAPFYIWTGLEQSRDFLFDDLFQNVIEAFSRPRVRSWMVLQAATGNRSFTPTYAIQEIDIISSDAPLSSLLQKEKEEQAQLLANPNLYYHAVAFDANRWELLRYSVWKDKEQAEKPASDCIFTYDILHVSGS